MEGKTGKRKMSLISALLAGELLTGNVKSGLECIYTRYLI